ncbi:MAG: SIR2 family protein [Candidatus Dadabacteria bacterium]|nr:SIR2 family protein [Candidatus Dadabacteria bacterium]
MSEKKNLLIFAGAGASVDLGYPTTREFMEHLNHEVINNYIYKPIPKSEKIDIERVLWFIKAEILEPIENCLIKNDFLHKNCYLFYLNHNPGNNVHSAQEYYGKAKELTEKINQIVHSSYGVSSIKNQDLRETGYWVNELINSGKPSDDHYNIEIFTTNYDRAIEKALEDNGIPPQRISPFSNSDFNTLLNTDKYSTKKAFSRKIWLTKLHGSLEWRLTENGEIEKVIEEFSDKSSVLYPGFKGAPKEKPFKQFHEYFTACLQKCDAFLSMGFSYRDEHINDLIKNNLKPQSEIYIIDTDPDGILDKEIWRSWENPQNIKATRNNIDYSSVYAAKQYLRD